MGLPDIEKLEAAKRRAEQDLRFAAMVYADPDRYTASYPPAMTPPLEQAALAYTAATEAVLRAIVVRGMAESAAP